MTTRQQIEEVLAEFEGERISHTLINDICSAIFRPVFEPKSREWIAVRHHISEPWRRRIFLRKEGDRFVCESLSSKNLEIWWPFAKPINSEGLGE